VPFERTPCVLLWMVRPGPVSESTLNASNSHRGCITRFPDSGLRREPKGHSQLTLQFRFIPQRNSFMNYSESISSALAEEPLEAAPCAEVSLPFRRRDLGNAAEAGRGHKAVGRSQVGVWTASALQF